MIKNYLKTAWRNIVKNPSPSIINIGGLAVGMAVAMVIGLWIYDELSFDKYHQNYDKIAMVMQSETTNGNVSTGAAVSLPLDAALRKNYGGDFKYIALCSFPEKHVLNAGDKNITYQGDFMGAEAPEMFSLKMLAGTRDGLKDQSSILISQSVAIALFGSDEVINKILKLDNKDSFKISGVYKDLPANTTFHDVAFIAPWNYYINVPENRRSPTDWGDNSLFVYVQVADHADMALVSEKIKNIKYDNMDPADRKFKPVMFLQPMRKWHLYNEFKNGVNTGGAIQYVWLFGIIGTFVLLLACINFMNLSTARSERRAKEVGVRKAIGSGRRQLIYQFFSESMLIAMLAFVLSLLLALVMLPYFNNIAGKSLGILWDKPLFWLGGVLFTLFTGLVAGSYPALYLSSFKPQKVLKGAFKASRYAAVPRKVLVVMQFSVSVMLIIGTIVVFKQVQYAKDRPIGYNRAGLVDIEVTNADLHKNFAAFGDDLLNSASVTGVAESSSSTTGINNDRGDITWKGKDPALSDYFGQVNVTSGYGKTVGWQFTQGRDFSAQSAADSMSLVLNEAAVKYMGLKNPVGEIIKVGNKYMTVIGVIRNMVMESPYDPVKQTIYRLSGYPQDHIIIRINPNSSAHDALAKIGAVCKTYSPSVPFDYKFADDEYARKFDIEERVGSLANSFSILAIFISCIGLFGMASYMAEQRTKEIGVRKVLGATVVGLWGLLSKDFVKLVIIALLIAIPSAYYFMDKWLQYYTYRTGISWWIFALTALGAIFITLATVSYQSIKAALMNPVKSLKSE